ncbi:MAG: glycosyl hydrolase, partial [Mariniphaga sp.]
LAGDAADPEVAERVRSDYRETLAELVLESFIQPMTEWANSHESMNRNQAHGSPGNILDLYAACDVPETEIFGRIEPGTVDVFVNKFASSAAHVTGKKLVSSESFTWLDEHWTVTPADMLRATNRLFLAGVNHMFLHGTCYSPNDAQWPGWLFYASSQINNRNPLWHELPALFKYIERSQTILQQATPQNDVLVYWPYYDVAAQQKGRLFFRTNIDHGDRSSWFSDYPLAGLSQNLTDAGYTFDYISDRQLLNCRIDNGEIVTEGETRYKAVVFPQTRYIPVETMQQIETFVAEGGRVYFDGSLPESIPGMDDREKRQQMLGVINAGLDVDNLSGNVLEWLPRKGIQPERSLSEKGFRFTRMEFEGDTWYMVVNCTTEALDERVELSAPAKAYVFYFPENENIALAHAEGQSVRLQLEPEQMVFIRCAPEIINVPACTYYNKDAPTHELEGMWKISFMNGGPVYPGDVSTDKLVSWTRMGDENTTRFAGTARYILEFDWNEPFGTGWLNLGEVKDCARVKLNGKKYGSLLGPSFKVKVDNLTQGKNLLEVEVTNVAANRIRDLDRRRVNWKKFHDINFVNIDYEPFDASGWKIREAGLLGKVEVTAVEQE